MSPGSTVGRAGLASSTAIVAHVRQSGWTRFKHCDRRTRTTVTDDACMKGLPADRISPVGASGTNREVSDSEGEPAVPL
jgi:hypothetical protein